jgi:hypothetical protein
MKIDDKAPLELIRLWQEKTQAFFTDPKVVEIMVGGMQTGQDLFDKMRDMGEGYAENNPKQTDDSIHKLHDAINQLSLRLAAIELKFSQLDQSTKGN